MKGQALVKVNSLRKRKTGLLRCVAQTKLHIQAYATSSRHPLIWQYFILDHVTVLNAHLERSGSLICSFQFSVSIQLSYVCIF